MWEETHGGERDDAQERDDEFDSRGPVDELGCGLIAQMIFGVSMEHDQAVR